MLCTSYLVIPTHQAKAAFRLMVFGSISSEIVNKTALNGRMAHNPSTGEETLVSSVVSLSTGPTTNSGFSRQEDRSSPPCEVRASSADGVIHPRSERFTTSSEFPHGVVHLNNQSEFADGSDIMSLPFASSPGIVPVIPPRVNPSMKLAFEWQLDALEDEYELARQYWIAGGRSALLNRCVMALRLVATYGDSTVEFDWMSSLDRFAYKHYMLSNGRLTPTRLLRFWRQVGARYVRDTWSPTGERNLPHGYKIQPWTIIPTETDIRSQLDLFGHCKRPDWLLTGQCDGARVSRAYSEELDFHLARDFDECVVQAGDRSLRSEAMWALLYTGMLACLIGEVLYWNFAPHIVVHRRLFDWALVMLFATVLYGPTRVGPRQLRSPTFWFCARILATVIFSLALFHALGKMFSSNDAGDGPFFYTSPLQAFPACDMLPAWEVRSNCYEELFPELWGLVTSPGVPERPTYIDTDTMWGSFTNDANVIGLLFFLFTVVSSFFIFMFNLRGGLLKASSSVHCWCENLSFLRVGSIILGGCFASLGYAYVQVRDPFQFSVDDLGVVSSSSTPASDLVSAFLADSWAWYSLFLCAMFIVLFFWWLTDFYWSGEAYQHVDIEDLRHTAICYTTRDLRFLGLRCRTISYERFRDFIRMRLSDLLRRVRRDMDRVNSKLVPQSGESILTELRVIYSRYAPELERYFPGVQREQILRRLEAVAAFAVNISNARSVLHVITSCVGLSHGLFEGSVCAKLCSVARDMFDAFTEETAPDGELSVQSGIWQGCKDFLTKWRDMADSAFASKVHEFLALSSYVGVFKAINLPVKTEEFKNYYKETKLHERWSVSIHLQIFECVLFIIERIGEFARTWSITSLLFSDKEARELDAEFAYLKGNFARFKTGGLEKDTVERDGRDVPRVTDIEFRNRIFALLAKMRLINNTFQTKKLHTPERVIFLRKLEAMEQMNSEVIAGLNAKVMRKAPFAVTLAGYSGQGKTGIVTTISKVFCKALNVPFFESLVVNVNAKDNFQSEVKTSHLGIILDDFANTKQEFVSAPPTDLVIDIVNNARKFVLKADLAEKGMVQWNNAFLVATTNVRNLDAHVYSNEPGAVLRRFALHIVMRVREIFALPHGPNDIPVLDPSKMGERILDDAWEFDVMKVVLSRGGDVDDHVPGHQPCKVSFEFVEAPTEVHGESRPLKNISVYELNYVLYHACTRHMEHQTSFVERLEVMAATPICDHFRMQPDCEICGLDVQAGEEEVDVLRPSVRVFEAICTSLFFGWACIDAAFSKLAELSCYHFECFVHPDFSGLVARSCAESTNYWRRFVMILIAYTLVLYTMSAFQISFFAFCVFRSYWWSVRIGVVLSFLIVLSRGRWLFDRVFKDVSSRLLSSARESASAALRNRYKFLVLAVLGIGILATVMERYVDHEVKADVQGGFYSIPARDKIQRPDPWVAVDRVQALPIGVKTRNMTLTQFTDVVSRSQVYVEATAGGPKIRYSNGIFLATNFLLIPYHTLLVDGCYANELAIHFTNKENRGSHYRVRISKDVVKRVPDRDLAVVYTATGGARRDLIELGSFPEEIITRSALAIGEIHRSREGEVSELRYPAASCVVTDVTRPEVELRGTYPGYSYIRPTHTFVGLCGSTLISRVVGGPCIVGFHLLGVTGAQVGRACSVTAPMLRETINALKEQCPLVHQAADCHVEVPFLPQSYEFAKPFELYDDVHEKSAIAQLPLGARIRSYGAHNQPRRSTRTQIVPMKIAESVSRICDVPISHGPPKNLGKDQVWLENLEPATGFYQFDPSILRLAYEDLRDHILGAVTANKKLLGPIKPYALSVVTSGVAGVRGVNAMNMKASMGFPWCKAKNNFLKRGVPAPPDFPDGIIEVPEEILADIERAREMCKAGHRPGTVFRACQKDEAVKLTKEKVRTFSSSNVILSILTRQYFLPVARIMNQFPFLFNTAVGINCYGPEWQQVYDYLTTFGKDRAFAGDFEKYDKRFEYQLQILCWKLLISVAEILGYDDEELRIMRCLAEDTARPIWEFNGDMQEHETQNSSGHDLTVQINGLGNVLQTMYAFYSQIPTARTEVKFKNLTKLTLEKLVPDLRWGYMDQLDAKPLHSCLTGRFSKYVAAITLGDDNVISVSPHCEWFNHMVMSDALKRVGLSYTTADKKEPSEPFEGMDRVTFLKRRFVYHSDMGRVAAPIEEASIWKSLFCRKDSSPVIEDAHCAEKLNDALREFGLFGQGRFEDMREKFDRVVDEHGIRHWLPQGQLHTYQYCLDWYSTFSGDEDQDADSCDDTCSDTPLE